MASQDLFSFHIIDCAYYLQRPLQVVSLVKNSSYRSLVAHPAVTQAKSIVPLPKSPSSSKNQFSDESGVMSRLMQRRYDLVWLTSFAVVVVVVHFLVCGSWQGWDDAFITYRLAAMNASGHWFHWNVSDPPVYGATSFLWLMLMTVWAGFFGVGSLPASAIGLGLLFHGAAAYIAYRLLGGWSGILAGALIAIDGFGYWATVGMETWLFTALVLGTAWAYQQSRFHLTAILCGLLVLARPDGVILVALIAVHFWVNQKRLPLRELGLFILTLSPWLITSLVVFGTVIPHGLEAKQVQASYGLIGGYTLTAYRYFLGHIPEVVFGLAAIGAWFNRKTVVPILVGFALLDHLAYWSEGIAAFPWYYVPGLTCLWVGAASLISQSARPALYIGGISIIGLCSVVQFAFADRVFWGMGGDCEWAIAKRVRSESTPSDIVCSISAGIIGFENLDMKVEDVTGILSPAALDALQNRRSAAYIMSLHPKWISLSVSNQSRFLREVLDRVDSTQYEGDVMWDRPGRGYVLLKSRS